MYLGFSFSPYASAAASKSAAAEAEAKANAAARVEVAKARAASRKFQAEQSRMTAETKATERSKWIVPVAAVGALAAVGLGLFLLNRSRAKRGGSR